MASTSRHEITRDLTRLGIVPGDLLAVHSALSSLWHVTGGAAAALDGILDAVGPDGTVVMPAFVRARGPEASLPIPQRTIMTGAIPTALAARTKTQRSFAGPGSLVVHGRLSGEIATSAGERFAEGPLGQVYERDGRILLLGVGQRRNTSLHVAEELAGVYPPSYHGEAFGKMDAILRDLGLLTEGKVAGAATQLMSARSVVDATIALLHQDPLALWCGDRSCPRCPAVLAAGRG
jgi:aminoglycoside N3'-acetyltransferase